MHYQNGFHKLMLHKTRGIVFQVTDFGETSVVAKIYTELFGLQGFLINSVRKKNAKVKQNVLHPLSLVDLVVYHKERKGLHRVAEVRSNPVLQNIPFHIVKNSMILFLDEVLCKAIREEEPNQQLFEFLFHSIQLLDVQSPVNRDFHLCFLIQLSKYLGFYPSENFSGEEKIFNLREGIFQADIPGHINYVDGPLSEIFFSLLQSSLDFSAALNVPVMQKRMLIEKILEYYRLHLTGFSEMKSLRVLEEVWS
jgi:DNA repair protein RecO (recombination protein O)